MMEIFEKIPPNKINYCKVLICSDLFEPSEIKVFDYNYETNELLLSGE